MSVNVNPAERKKVNNKRLSLEEARSRHGHVRFKNLLSGDTIYIASEEPHIDEHTVCLHKELLSHFLDVPYRCVWGPLHMLAPTFSQHVTALDTEKVFEFVITGFRGPFAPGCFPDEMWDTNCLCCDDWVRTATTCSWCEPLLFCSRCVKDGLCWQCNSDINGWEPQTTREKLLHQARIGALKGEYIGEPPDESGLSVYMAKMREHQTHSFERFLL